MRSTAGVALLAPLSVATSVIYFARSVEADLVVVDEAIEAWAAYAFSAVGSGHVIGANFKRDAIVSYAKLG